MRDARVRAVLRGSQPPLRRFWSSVAFGVLSAASAVALLAASAWLITRASEQPSLIYVSVAVVGVRAFALSRAVFRYLERLAGHDAAFHQLASIRAGMVAELVPLAPDGLGDTRRGDLLSTLADDVDELQNRSLRVIQPLVTAGIVAVLTVVGVTILLPAAGLILAVTLALAGIFGTIVNGSFSSKAERAIATLRAELNDRVLDLVSNLAVLTAFGALAGETRKAVDAGATLTRAIRSRASAAALTAGLVSVLAGGATIGAFLVGVPALDAHRIDAPALAVLALVPLAVFEVFGMLPLALGARRQVIASAERIARTVPATIPAAVPVDLPQPVDLPLPAALPSSAHDPVLVLDGVTARWPNVEQPVLRGVSLRLHRGERMVIEGPTGSGKTALAHVLTRFIDYEGSYRLAGVEARDLAQDDVRTVVGLCEQQPYLFDSDIRQNLLFARDTATDADLEAVLERVGLAEWLRDRGGLDARVGERGALVSGGQAQRIALARALLADVSVLIADEPTANVDLDVADRIVRDIVTAASQAGTAVILISHVAVAPDLVDVRLRMEEGRLRRTVADPVPDGTADSDVSPEGVPAR
ncbi:thiol reductant ABC exporter subunit CydC [Diaminobutyricibacter tongyongensis]|uniref:Thiol reductant ABC exporter subunit CydC n=1 Tax=Leifsonia tongyongensis TaxID=1268043 RepID=A0A6L9XYY1_9MICO|nr:thiol reductant ABC exporter subunit CydC [Diaminobutyricibacter tongyongensis]NEN06506.1 thiol reductant ABC exporter subunit CydC [Diaminobutyricibacter tongyongensis]